MTARPSTITLPAHAKINLALSVGPPTPPKGYHPIASWFAAIGLHDTVRLTRLDEGAPTRHEIRWGTSADGAPAPRPTPIDWPIEKDLAVRAHRLLETHIGRTLPVHLELIKRTPVGGGLGGGSSDAASTLVGLNRLFRLGLAHTELARLSTALGSDIAFFIDEAPERAPASDPANSDDPAPASTPRPALVTGFGERIERTRAPLITDVLLLLPPFGCPTGPVYGAFDALPARAVDESRVRALVDACLPIGARALDPARLFNDLAAPACAVEPRLGDLLARLRPLAPHAVHVTGSGSTMFVIPDPGSPIALRELAARAETLAPELIVIPTTTL